MMKKTMTAAILLSTVLLLAACETGKKADAPAKEATASSALASNASTATSDAKKSSKADKSDKSDKADKSDQKESSAQEVVTNEFDGDYSIKKEDGSSIWLSIWGTGGQYSELDAEGQVKRSESLTLDAAVKTLKVGDVEGTYEIKEDGTLVIKLGEEVLDFPADAKLPAPEAF